MLINIFHCWICHLILNYGKLNMDSVLIYLTMHLYWITSPAGFWKERFELLQQVIYCQILNLQFFAYHLMCSWVIQPKINIKHTNFKDLRFLLLKTRPKVRKEFCHEALHHLLDTIYIILSIIRKNEHSFQVTTRTKNILNAATNITLKWMKYCCEKWRTNNVKKFFY